VARDFHTEHDSRCGFLDGGYDVEIVFLEVLEDPSGLLQEGSGLAEFDLGLLLEDLSLCLLLSGLRLVLGDDDLLGVGLRLVLG
jgi:hypothetical protein